MKLQHFCHTPWSVFHKRYLRSPSYEYLILILMNNKQRYVLEINSATYLDH